MAKVSVGLRGWRFDESAIFDADGEFRPLDEMPDDDRERLLRLTTLVERPCDACYLVHGEAEMERCRVAAVVYGEPGDEVVLCPDHETDFVYWFREAGGEAYRGDPDLREAFHDWFADGGRAPEAYAGLDHVDTDPDALPDPPDAAELQRRIEESFDGAEVNLREAARRLDGVDLPDDVVTEEDLADAAVDLDAEYPGDDG